MCEGINQFWGRGYGIIEYLCRSIPNETIMKHWKTVVVILLNLLFCAAMLWLHSRNCFLRPFSGSVLKEFISGLLLLGSLYFNYFYLYPKFCRKSPARYWLSVVLMSVAVGAVDMALAYRYISSFNAYLVQLVGPFVFFSKRLSHIIFRNLALNFFPFLFRERKYYRQSLEKEVQIVYRDVRKLDVTDKERNVHLVVIDDIFYCLQQGNYTRIYTVQNEQYTRLGSMKHLEQLFGAEEFVRITPTLLVPFRYIQSCQNDTVVMKKMPWERKPTVFQLETKTCEEIAEWIAEKGKGVVEKDILPNTKRKTAAPSEDKVQKVLAYIESHPNCNSADIIGGTEYSQSTVERCLAELKKQGVIEYTGSKKRGGYKRV